MNYDVQRISEVGEETLQRCFELMSANYLGMAEDLFRRAFAEKDLIILFQNEEQKICGFTLLGFNMCGTGTERYNVLYSGDTIMDVEYWGTRGCTRGRCHRRFDIGFRPVSRSDSHSTPSKGPQGGCRSSAWSAEG